MGSLIFDIESVGENFETDFGEYEQAYFLKYAQTEEEKEEYKMKTALSPLTGKAVSIAYWDSQSKQSFVHTVSDKVENYERENTKFLFYKTEKELLSEFWKVVLKYPQIVTFNGRGFDVPFLMIRSAIHQVRPTRNLMPYRYDYKVHCDLSDQMSFYGALRFPRSLHFYTRAFGIASPKDEMEGVQVTEFYNKGKHKEIAEYALKDVIATGALFEYWDMYLKF